MGIAVIVVGLGFGADFVPIYQAHESVDRVAVVDADQARAAAVADRFGVADRFASLEEALDAPGWDAIHLLTPVALHAGQVQQVLKSGRHCASAVPMATTLGDLDLLISAEEGAGRNYMMMETAVYSREFFHARSLLDAGKLGRLAYFRGEHLQNLDGYPPYWLGYPPMHYVTHALSPALALSGEQVESVRCLGSSRLTSDKIGVAGPGFGTEAALFKLSGDEDLVANVTMSFFQLGRSYLEGFSVYGDQGALEWPQLEGGAMKEFSMLPHEPGQRGRVVTEADIHPAGASDRLPEPLRPFTTGGHGGSHPHLVHEFVSSIVEGRPARVNSRTAAEWTAPGICAHQSALRDGVEVTVPNYRTT